MLELIKFLNKHSKTFLNISILFISLIITVHLFVNKEDNFDNSSFVENEIQRRIGTVTDTVSNIADSVFPISSSFQTVSSINEIDNQPIVAQLQPEASEEREMKIMQILQNKMIQDTILKAFLVVLISYLLIGFICRQD